MQKELLLHSHERRGVVSYSSLGMFTRFGGLILENNLLGTGLQETL